MVVISDTVTHCLIFKNRTSTTETLHEVQNYLSSSGLIRDTVLTTKDVTVSTRNGYNHGLSNIAMAGQFIQVRRIEKPRTLVSNLSPSTPYPRIIKTTGYKSDFNQILVIKAINQQIYEQFKLLADNSFLFERNKKFELRICKILGFIIRAINDIN